MTSHKQLPQTFWRKRAASLRRQVYAGWWWHYFSRVAAGSALAVSIVVVVARFNGQSTDWLPVAILSLLLVATLAAGLWARRHRISFDAALSRLDEALGMHHRLLSAEAGVGDWPPVPRDAADPRASRTLRCQWSSIGIPAILMISPVALSLLVPVSAGGTSQTRTYREPPEWAAMETMLNQLDEEEIVQPEAIQDALDRIESLRRQPREDWYQQGSLEATDHIRQQIEHGARQLEQAINSTASLLEAAANRQTEMTSEQRDNLSAGLKDLIADLDSGAMPLNEELTNLIRQADPSSNMASMSPEEMKKLEQQLRECSGSLKACTSGAPGEDEGETGGTSCRPGEAPESLLEKGEASGAESNSGKPGSGGVNRGPGSDPSLFGDKSTASAAGSPLALQNNDMTRAAPRETVRLLEGVHEVDPTATIQTEAGAAASVGGAGVATWQYSALPSEQRVLKSYFKGRTSQP